MTFEVNITDKRSQRKDPQVYNAAQNLLHSFIQAIGGVGVIRDRDSKGIAPCDGFTEWALGRYKIEANVKYESKIKTFGKLKPNPLDDDENLINWDLPTIYFDQILKSPLSKDEEQSIMDPVFIGPRSLQERKFFRSEAIKLGIRKKVVPQHLNLSFAYTLCQTPELKRWGQDLDYAELLAADGEDAHQWIQDRGYKTAVFWQEKSIIVSSIEFTMPGCENRPLSYERLLFVMKFGGGY
jgi:hypothetical protein